MSFIRSAGKFLTNNFIGSIGNVLTIVTSIYGIVSEIVAHVNGDGTYNDVEDPVLEGVTQLQEDVTALREEVAGVESALTNLILAEFSGLQQQLLASAQSRAESALDLLASYQIDPDIDRGEIIADVSRALRDTLSQGRQMLDSNESTTSLDALKAAMGAVGYTLYARLEVARELEGDEIASDKIAKQIDDSMTFLEDLVKYVEERLTVKITGSPTTFTVYLDDEPFSAFYSVGFTRDAKAQSLGYGNTPFTFSPWITNRAADFAGPYKVDMLNFYPIYYIPSIDKIIDLNATPSEYYDANGNLVARDFPGARPAVDVLYAEGKAWVLEQVMQWFNIDRVALAETIAGFRDLTDGEQMILPSIPGFENDGTLIGTDGNDLLIGNDGNDFLYGEGDPDLVRGMEGDDTVHGGEDSDRLEGNEGDDKLYGDEGDDALIGGLGNDIIDGGDGRDLAIYSEKRAEYIVTWSRDGGQLRVVVDGPEGRDELINVERLVFDNRMVQFQTGGADEPLLGDILFSDGTRRIAEDIMFGQAFSTLSGGMGDDMLFSGGGVARLQGGTGNDLIQGTPGLAFLFSDTAVFTGARVTYSFQVSLDQVIVTGPEGTDILRDIDYLEFNDATINWRRSDFIQQFNVWVASGSGGEDILTGSSRDEFLTGNGGNDIVLGGAGKDKIHGDSSTQPVMGADWLDGGAGNDTVNGGAGNDVITGGSGIDRLYGDEGNDEIDGSAGDDKLWGGLHDDILVGGEGNDVLRGGDRHDELNGGLGADVMLGGIGMDTFVYAATRESGTTNATRDTIEKFVNGTDRIDVSAIDAIVSTDADEAFVFKADGVINGLGQIRAVNVAGGCVLEFNTQGNLAPEMTIFIARGDAANFSGNDFIL